MTYLHTKCQKDAPGIPWVFLPSLLWRYRTVAALTLLGLLLSGCTASGPRWLPAFPWWDRGEPDVAALPELWLASSPAADVSPTQLQTALDAFNTSRGDLRADLVVPADYADALEDIRVGEEVAVREIRAASAALTQTATLSQTATDTRMDPVTGMVNSEISSVQEARIDLLYVDSYTLPDLVDGGALLPISQLISGTNLSALTADFYPPLLDAFTIDGDLYCLPHTFNTLALIYNLTLLEQAGQPYPTNAWRWEELTTVAQAVQEWETVFYATYGLSLSADASRWLPFLYAAGGQWIASDGRAMTINNDTTLNSLNAYLNLLFDGVALLPSDLSSSWNGEAFRKERIAMTVEGNWIVPYLNEQNPDLSYGIAPLPGGSAGSATLFFSGCYAISAYSEQPAAALDLALHLTSIDTLSTWSAEFSAAPARVSLRDPWLAQHPTMEPFVSGLDYARPWQFPPGMHAVVDALNSGMIQALNGDIPPEEILRVAEVIGNDVLAGE